MLVRRGKFQVEMPGHLTGDIISACAKADGAETGGILVGIYSDGWTRAVVTDLVDAPTDSKGAERHFERGIAGVRDELIRFWEASPRRYYLGEWHSHPDGPPWPSDEDTASMRAIAKDPAASCPEPVLLLIGGACRYETDIAIHVMTAHYAPVELVEVQG